MTTSWTDPKTGTTVRPGDIWQDNDPRQKARQVRITSVDVHFVAYRTVGFAEHRKPTEARSHAFVKRFALVERAPAADPNALKPCPFCGGVNLIVDALIAAIECRSCAAGGPVGDCDAPRDKQEADARRLWNARAEVPRG